MSAVTKRRWGLFCLLALSLSSSAFLLRGLLTLAPPASAFAQTLVPSSESALRNSFFSPVSPGGWRTQAVPAEPHRHRFSAVPVESFEPFELIFPQLGNGRVVSTGESLRTLIQAVNLSTQPARCRLSLFNDDGLPLVFSLNGSAVSTLEFELERGQQQLFETDGEGEVLAGWALLESDQPVSGAVVYGLRDAAGGLLTEVGVSAAEPGSDLTIVADSLGDTQTGIALANPGTAALRITAELMDADGESLATREVDLAGRGHRAVFLNQLFSEVAGISELLGSVRLQSEAASPFAAMTLRSTGALLTSLPTIGPPAPDSEITRLAFPHVADGVQAPLAITTGLVLVNNRDAPAEISLDFFRSDAAPMTVVIDGRSDSSFDFQLPPRGLLKVETEGRGELQAGWARARMNGPLSGSAIFRVFREQPAAAASPAGAGSRILETEVGVANSPFYEDFRILIDNRGAVNTGLAVTNNGDEGFATTLSVELRSRQGAFLERARLEVPPGGHRAIFVDQLFPARDLTDFTGFLSLLRAPGPRVAAVALRSSGAKLTSIPTLVPTHGFAPEIEVRPLQNLAGASPGLAWNLHQNVGDFALRELAIRLPRMSLPAESSREPGDAIGTGYLTGGGMTRTFSLILRQVADESIAFDLVVDDPDGGVPGGSGVIRQEADGLHIRWSLFDPQPYTMVAADVDYAFFLFPGILQAPAAAAAENLETEMTSVSSDLTSDRPAIRITRQPLAFVEPAEGAATLEIVSPLFVTPGSSLRFDGANLGDNPRITFPLQDGENLSVKAYRNGEGILEVEAPAGVAEGLIFADNGNGAGNGYRIHALFSPWTGLSLQPSGAGPAGSASSPDLLIELDQPAGQLALSHFDVELRDAVLAFETLTVGQNVGSGTVRPNNLVSNPLGLTVAAVSADSVTIDVEQLNFSGGVIAQLNITQVPDEFFPSLLLQYRPLQLETETVILRGRELVDLDLSLSGLALQLPRGGLGIAEFRVFSTPTLPGLAESALEVRLDNLFLVEEENP